MDPIRELLARDLGRNRNLCVQVEDLPKAHTTIKLVQEIQNLMEKDLRIQPQNYVDRIMFMLQHSSQVSVCAKKCSKVDWTFLGLGDENKGRSPTSRNGVWNCAAEAMMANFAESGHPLLRGTGPLFRGSLKRRGGKMSIHFNAESQTADLLFRTVLAVNHLGVHGAVAYSCNGPCSHEKESF